MVLLVSWGFSAPPAPTTAAEHLTGTNEFVLTLPGRQGKIITGGRTEWSCDLPKLMHRARNWSWNPKSLPASFSARPFSAGTLWEFQCYNTWSRTPSKMLLCITVKQYAFVVGHGEHKPQAEGDKRKSLTWRSILLYKAGLFSRVF